jgi:very-short-patch-repair endonuclease
MEYLNEKNLGICINKLYNTEFIHDIKFKESRYRPDYRSDEYMVIFEFDGFAHYNQNATIFRDFNKDTLYKDYGYTLYRIPFFVQFDLNYIKNILKKDCNNYIDSDFIVYPNGFIDKKCMLPSDFNELGIERFLEDLEKFSYAKEDILKSLTNKINELGDIRKVIPKSLYNIF